MNDYVSADRKGCGVPCPSDRRAPTIKNIENRRMKYRVKIKNGASHFIETGLEKMPDKMEQILLDDVSAEWSAQEVAPDVFSVLYKDKSYSAELVAMNRQQKTMLLTVDGHELEVQIQEPVDMVLEKMGWESAAKQQVNQIISPMPGMILKIYVTEGQKVEKGDPILVLEAMKMENVFKASEAATVKEVKVKENTVVEKGMVLVVLE